jgi:hypothetical protein
MKSSNNTPLKNKLTNLLNNSGVILASKAVGGFRNLASILEIDLNDQETIYNLVKNYIHFSDSNPSIKSILDRDEIEIVLLEIRTSVSGNKIININFNSGQPASNEESFIMSIFADEMNKFFPFVIKKAYEPSFSAKNHPKVIIDATLLRYDNLGNVINETIKIIPTSIKRRQSEIYKLFKSNLKQLKLDICEYGSPRTLMDRLIYETATDLYMIYFDGIDESSNEWKTIYEGLEILLDQEYYNKIKNTFKRNCR